MSPIALTAVATLGLALALLVWVVLDPAGRERRQVRTNLGRGLPADAGANAGPAGPESTGGRTALVRRLTPIKAVERLESLLARAGRPPAWPLERLLAAKILLTAGAATLSLVFASAAPGLPAVLFGMTVTTVAYFLPDLLLLGRGQERSKAISLELADTLDQMTIAVEAGLGFEAAMERAGRNGTGPLADEMVRTLQDMQMGLSRKQAYASFATRTEVPDLRRFVRAVVQADTYGIAIADVLRTQASEMRTKRRQRAEEKAMKVPVKVLFPLMLCILPVLFIVLLGPAVIGAIETFN
ncbi:type II secretion system F family protein [Antribacter sp. KLBMP9083]|uniref:Type II secretion system F family protein n=1 Tax=Antribacter soli TaxID=2910976 RepID=A0AA41QG26_9MICO|nr:type II secretion system F family protein [Antribacter soli]MCF4122808.1 type II secretion system F family protein [Antribacter soli]